MKIEKEEAVQKAKAIGEFIAGGSTFMLVDGIARAVLPPQIKPIVQIGMFVGSSLLSGCVTMHVSEYVGKSIDSVAEVSDSTKKAYGSEFKKLKETIKNKPEIEEMG